MLTLRGQAYFSLGDLDMAARHTSEALQSDPEFAQAKKLHKTVSGIKRLLAQAKKLMEQGDLGGAMAKFEKIEVDYAPLPRITHRDLLLDMCRCSGKLKKREWVYKTCIASMQLDESWLDVRIAFAEILRDLADSTEELEEVVREWKKAMNLDQQNGHIHDQLRRAEAALKQSRTKNYYKILNVKRTATAGR
ncbi:hypothetical protein BASA81_001621 [Batrachochytrium salamandrivorans]|nr:hypothetical protein BASA81_001621 [Batrachochytrium salamandrivorans]